MGEEIEGGHSGEVRRLRWVILEGEEIEVCHTMAEGPQLAKRACLWLELLVLIIVCG